MRIGVRISEFFMHAWVIFLNKYLCMLIMIPGECTDPLRLLCNFFNDFSVMLIVQ